MILTLYKTVDGVNILNKQLTNPVSMTINLKHDTDIVSPTLYLTSVTGLLNGGFNYLYIDEVDRYYFIDRVESVNNKLVRIECTCDVLMTYKQNILNSKAKVKRALKTGDYIDTVIERSHLTTVTKFDSDITLPDESVIILATVGSD